jgi:hypothetical protein
MVDPRAAGSRAVQLRVVVGRADRGILVLVAGAQPVSVGMQADWVIVADGVSPVHFYVAFDGNQVFLTPASPRETVLVGGLPIGAGWTAAAIPAELRFAGARVVLEAAPQAVDLPAPMSAMTTMSDNGALFQEARRVLELELAAAANKPPAPFANIPLDGTREYPSGAPEAPVDRRYEATLSVVRSPGPGISFETPRQVTKTAYGGIEVVPSLQPPGAPHGIPSPPPTLSNLSDLSDQAPSTLDGELVRPPGPWRRASGATKASLILLPLAVVSGVYLYGVRQAQMAAPTLSAATPAPSRPAPPTTAALPPVTTPASLSAAPPASALPLQAPRRPSASPAKASLPAKPGGKTAERAALDAVAEGSFADAAKAYDDLAAQRPEDPDFREASRVLREKAARSH